MPIIRPPFLAAGPLRKNEKKKSTSMDEILEKMKSVLRQAETKEKKKKKNTTEDHFSMRSSRERGEADASIELDLVLRALGHLELSKTLEDDDHHDGHDTMRIARTRAVDEVRLELRLGRHSIDDVHTLGDRRSRVRMRIIIIIPGDL